MSEKVTAAVDERMKRRARINRIKIGIIVSIFGWMLISFLAIIILTANVISLRRKLNRMEERIQRIEETQRAPDEGPSSQKDDPPESFGQVLTGIDSPDNMAVAGDEHLVYLTFDGGPNRNTDAILDVLRDHGVRATFFVVGDESEDMQATYRRIVSEGHTLGMRSYSNQYSTLYASKEAFRQDCEKMLSLLENVTGVSCKYYRFPGGSGNEISNVNMVELVRILNEKGIAYFDWNVSGGDAVADYSAEDVISNVKEGVSRYKTSVVLLHDGDNKSTTVEALGPLIESLQDMQAKILPIDENTRVIQYIRADSVE